MEWKKGDMEWRIFLELRVIWVDVILLKKSKHGLYYFLKPVLEFWY